MRAPCNSALLLAPLLILAGFASSADPGSQAWSDRRTVKKGSIAGVAVAAENGRVFVGGRLRSGDIDQLMRAYATGRGRFLWQDRFDLVGRADELVGIAVDNGIVVSGGFGISESGDTEFIFRAHDASDGSPFWQAVTTSPEASEALRAVGAHGGRAFAVGHTDTGVAGNVLILALLARSGGVAWQAEFDQAGRFDTAGALAVGDRRLIAGGRGTTLRGDTNALVLAYEATLGTRLWTHAFGGQGNDRAVAVALAGNSRVAVAAEIARDKKSHDIELRVLRGAGRLAWAKKLTADGVNEVAGLAADRSMVWVAGNDGADASTSNASAESGVILAYRATNGRRQWAVPGPAGVPGGRYDDLVLTDDALIAVGSVPSQRGTGIFVAAFDADTGDLLWSDVRNPGNAHESAAALAVDGDRVIGVGSEQGGGQTALLIQAWNR